MYKHSNTKEEKSSDIIKIESLKKRNQRKIIHRTAKGKGGKRENKNNQGNQSNRWMYYRNNQ